MLRGSGEGAFVGFLGGVLLDSVSYTPFGINSALFGLVGYFIGLPEVNVYRGNLPYFLGTAAIVVLTPSIATRLGWLPAIVREPFAVTLAAQVGTLPLTASASDVPSSHSQFAYNPGANGR